MHNFLILLVLFIFAGCSIVPERTTVVLNENAWVKQGAEKPAKMNSGESIELSDEPIVVSSPHHATVVVLPPRDLKEIKLPIYNGENLFDAENSVVLSPGTVNRLVVEMSEIQFLIDQAHLNEALQRIRKLKTAFPYVDHLEFLEASTLVLLGEDDKARKILALVVKKSPKNPKAIELFESLGGEEFNSN